MVAAYNDLTRRREEVGKTASTNHQVVKAFFIGSVGIPPRYSDVKAL